MPSGHIVFGRAGNILSVPFDTQSGEITGGPSQVMEGVVTSDGYGSTHFSCSNDGTLVYVSGGPEQFTNELFFLYRDGRIDPIPQPARTYGTVRVSADGNRLAVSVLGANASVWIYDLRRRTMTRLVSTWDNHSPIWHPSDNRIAFGSNRSGAEAVWLMSADGFGQPTHVPNSEVSRYPSSWSPDGKWIAGSQPTTSSGTDIWLVDAEGTGATTEAITGPTQEFAPAFSPDGQWLAYNSDESGQTEIYVQAFPITGKKWKMSEDGGDSPVWSPSGHELYYWSEQSLMVVEVAQEPEFKPSRARVLTTLDIVNVHDFDIFPDGERFVIIGRAFTDSAKRTSILRGTGSHNRVFPALSPDLHIVTNWFDELEAAEQ
jgi:serine/threonine-protein kinase